MNIFQATRTLTFRKSEEGKLIISAQNPAITVKVKVEIDSDDYEHQQLVSDVITALLSSEENFNVLAEECNHDGGQ